MSRARREGDGAKKRAAIRYLHQAETGFVDQPNVTLGSITRSLERASRKKLSNLIDGLLTGDIQRYSSGLRTSGVGVMKQKTFADSLPNILHLAVAGGEYQIIRNIVTEQGVPRFAEGSRYPALMIAVARNDEKVVNLLLEKQTDQQLYAEHPDSGLTAFEVAHKLGHTDLAAELLDRMTPNNAMMQRAYASNDEDLLEQYYDKVNEHEFLIDAVENGDSALLQQHFQRSPINDDDVIASIESPQDLIFLQAYLMSGYPGITEFLKIAVEQKNDNALQILLESGCEATPETLEYAISQNNDTALEILLEHGNKATPQLLEVALDNNNSVAVKTLLEHGCNPNYQMSNGETPLTSACRAGASKVVHALLDKANPTMKNKEGNTPYQCIAEDAKLAQEDANRLRIEHTLEFADKLGNLMSSAHESAKGKAKDSIGRYSRRFNEYLRIAKDSKDLAECSKNLNAAIRSFVDQLESEAYPKGMIKSYNNTPLYDAVFKSTELVEALKTNYLPKRANATDYQSRFESMRSTLNELSERTGIESPRGIKRPAEPTQANQGPKGTWTRQPRPAVKQKTETLTMGQRGPKPGGG